MNHNPSHPKRMASRNAFTRIELISLIAVLAILASILGPALQKQASIAKRQQCAAKIRAWSNAFILYSYEHHGNAAVNAGGKWWYQVGTKYSIYRDYFYPATNISYYQDGLGSLESCPAEDNKNVVYGSLSITRNCYMPVIPWISEPTNQDFSEYTDVTLSIPLAKIYNPSQCLMFVERGFKTDGSAYIPSGGSINLYLRGLDPPSWQKNFLNFRRHNSSQNFRGIGLNESGPSNVAWCDGHVSTVYWSRDNEADNLSARINTVFNFQRWTKADYNSQR